MINFEVNTLVKFIIFINLIKIDLINFNILDNKF